MAVSSPHPQLRHLADSFVVELMWTAASAVVSLLSDAAVVSAWSVAVVSSLSAAVVWLLWTAAAVVALWSVVEAMLSAAGVWLSLVLEMALVAPGQAPPTPRRSLSDRIRSAAPAAGGG